MIVAPLVGAWIEICIVMINYVIIRVAPLVGAWIEIACNVAILSWHKCRSSCRSVD